MSDLVNQIEDSEAESLEALLLVERLLSNALRSPPTMEKLSNAGVSAADFERTQHGEIWTAMLAVHGRHGRADRSLVESHLRESMSWSAKEVRSWLNGIEENFGSIDDESMSLSLERIRAAAGLRRLKRAAMAILQAAQDRRRGVADIVSEATKELETIVAGTTNRMRAKSGRVLAEERRLRMATEKKQGFIRVPTGVPELDAAMRGGYRSGRGIIIAADASHGKTTTMGHMVLAAEAAGHRVLVVTFESSSDEITDMLIDAKAGIETVAASTGQEWAKIKEAEGWLSESRIELECIESVTVEEIIAKIHAIRNEPVKVGDEARALVVFIDYVQDIERSTRHARDDLNYVHISKALRRAFVRYDVAGVMLSQITESKDKFKPNPNGPTMDMLPFTRQWQKDAAYVVMADRDIGNDDEAKRNTTRYRLVKNRPDKKLARAWMRYDLATTRLTPSDAQGRTDDEQRTRTKKVTTIPLIDDDDFM